MTARARSGLGRGLSALLGEGPPPAGALADEERSGLRMIDVAAIRPNAQQPRRRFDEEALDELAASIGQRGVLQPILVRPAGDGFELIAGERRWRAAQRARLHQIPAIVRESDSATSAELALIENVQREDLNPLEEAQAYQQLIERHGHGQGEVAALVHKSRSHVANFLRLLGLPERVREMLLRGDISMGHARALVSSPDAERLAEEIAERGLSVREIEQLIRRGRPSRGTGGARPAAAPPDADIAALERQLADQVGLKVRIGHSAGGGTVTIHYTSLDQLDMICQRLSGEPI